MAEAEPAITPMTTEKEMPANNDVLQA